MIKAEYLKKNYIRMIVWAMFGMVTSMIISCMLFAGSVNIDKFYDVGECYDFYYYYIGVSGQNMVFDESSHIYTVTADAPGNIITLDSDLRAWKYIYFDVIETGQEEKLNARIDFYSETGEVITSMEVSLDAGENEIAVPDDISFNTLYISYHKNVGDYFGIENIEFTESQKVFTASVFIRNTLLMFLAYMILTGIVCLVKKTFHICFHPDWYAPVELLQRLFCIVGDECGKYVRQISEKTRGILRTLLFAGLIIYMQMAKNFGWYHSKGTYNYQLAAAAVILGLIALLCYERKTRICSWRNPLVGAWAALWVMACISDFLVPKRYAWTGYIMIFIVGFLFFMWNNMKDRMKLVKNMVNAVLIVYAIDAAYCFFCRPEMDGIRYSGVYHNPITFGADLAIVCILCIYVIDCKLEKGKKIYEFIPTFIWGITAVILLWKTQSATGLYVLPLCMVIFLIQQIKERRKPSKILALAAVCIVLAVPTYLGTDWCLHNLPYICNTVIESEKDFGVAKEDYKSLFTETVYAAETDMADKIKNNHAIDKFFNGTVSDILSGRDYFWKAYFREMNLFGHKGKGMALWGQNPVKPHNGLLMILYRYGVYTVIPYVMMLGANLVRTGRRFRRKDKDGLLVLMITVSVCMRLLVENVEYAFLGLDWLLFYLLMGAQFDGNVTEERDERFSRKKTK